MWNKYIQDKRNSLSERARPKLCHKHIDPALHDGQYAPVPTTDVYSFGYVAIKIAKAKKSELIEKFALWLLTAYKLKECYFMY